MVGCSSYSNELSLPIEYTHILHQRRALLGFPEGLARQDSLNLLVLSVDLGYPRAAFLLSCLAKPVVGVSLP